jgi:hypothetical protein
MNPHYTEKSKFVGIFMIAMIQAREWIYRRGCKGPETKKVILDVQEADARIFSWGLLCERSYDGGF